MTIDRRTFIRVGTGALVANRAATSRTGTAAVAAPRMALTAFVQDASRVAALKRGVAAMKARQPSDPTSWFYQGAIHGSSPEMVAAALQQDPNVANVNQARFWNQCPHYNQPPHPSADFLVWHRAYLYYFERILRDATGDLQFSLPYWNYSNPADRSIPDVYNTPDPDPANQQPRNPLYDARREYSFSRGLYMLSDRAVSFAKAFAAQSFFGITAADGFAGAWDDLEPDSNGLLERSPHNLLHLAIGGVIPTTPDPNGPAATGLMADVPTAAFDPLFWAHHSNIDRLWSTWDCLPNRNWGNAPAPSWFAERPWWFNDLGGAVINETRGYYIQHGSLDARYDTDSPGCVPLSSQLPTGGNPIFVTSMLRPTDSTPSQQPVEVGTTSAAINVANDRPTAAVLTVSQRRLFNREQSVWSAVLASAPAAPRFVFLELSGVSYGITPTVGYDVHINPPNTGALNDESPSFVGTLGLFGARRGSHRESADGVNRLFDVTTQARRSEWPRSVRVVLVPFDLHVPRSGRTPLRREADLHVGRIRLLIVEGGRRR